MLRQMEAPLKTDPILADAIAPTHPRLSKDPICLAVQSQATRFMCVSMLTASTSADAETLSDARTIRRDTYL